MGINSKNQMRPDMPALLDETKRDVQISINCHQIGVIQSFDATKQLATIKIAMKQIESIDDEGVKTLKDYPLLIQCPVIVLFGGVDILSMPIQAGDHCLVFFNDRQIDEWLNFGEGRAPTLSRVHDIADGIAIVGIRPLTNSISNYLTNGIRLSHGGGDSQIDLKDGLIDTIADLFFHHGSMRITGDLTIEGDTYGNGSGDWVLRANLQQEASKSIHAGNGANGTFDVVTVVDGIVISGS